MIREAGATAVFLHHRSQKYRKKFQINHFPKTAQNSGDVYKCNRFRWLKKTEENSERTVLLILEWDTSYEETYLINLNTNFKTANTKTYFLRAIF